MVTVKEDVKFYTGMKDRMFKSIFLNEDDIDLLESLVFQITNKGIKVDNILPTELLVKNKKEREKRLDSVFLADNEFYEIEVNSDYDEVVKVRNLMYFLSLISQFTRKGEEFRRDVKFIYIGINSSKNKSEPMVAEYKLYEPIYKIELADNIIFYEINIDKIIEAWNNKDIEIIQKYPILTSLNLGLDELKELVNITGSKEVERIMEKLEKLNSDLAFVAPFSKEEGDRLVANTRVSLAREQGIEQGIEKGIEQGIQQGKIEERKNIINQLLENSISITEIAKILNIPINEIKKILN